MQDSLIYLSPCRLRICRILLQHGADARMETREKEVRSILYHACLLTILQSALHHLWRPPSDSVDEYCHVLLVVTKQDPRLCNSPNLIGETPLHKLCLKGDRPTVAAFLKCTAANVNAANHLGEVRHRLSHHCLSIFT